MGFSSCPIVHNTMDRPKYLNSDSKHPGGEVLEAGGLPAERVPEWFVHRSVPYVLFRVVQEQDFEIVLERVADQDPILEDGGHLFLHKLEVLAVRNVLEKRSNNS